MTFDRLRQVVRLRLRSLLFGAAADRELDEELQFHVDRQIEVHIARGLAPEDARRLALGAIGGAEQRKEEMRDARGVAVIENLLRDVRLAIRQLRKQPGFTVTALASLALGIGANTAIFQLLNALSLRTLPVRAPHELVEVRLTGDGRDGRHNGRNRQVSLPQYQELARRQQAFSSFMAFGDTRFNLAPQGEVRYVDGLWVSGTFFGTLEVQPLLGRLIAPADDHANCGASVAVISYALWQSEFGGRPDVVGRLISSGPARIPIIGVTPPEFFGVEVGRQFGVARPICASGFGRNDHWWLAAIGRLKPGWSAAQAEAHLAQVLPSIQRATMPEYRPDLADEYLKMAADVVDASAGVSPLRRSYQRPLWILMAISALVLLIAAVNLANLLLARATARAPEFAIRLAIGGSAGRVLQQTLTESLVLALLGGAAALGVALAVSQSIPPLISTTVDRIHLDLSMDWRVFGFTAMVGVAAAMIFGAAPAVRATRASMVRGTRGAASDGLSIRRALVALQIAVTLVLLFGGMLFLRTFQNLATQDTGVGEREVVIATVFFGAESYPVERRDAAFAVLDDRISTLPGMINAAIAYTTPMGGSIWDTDIISDSRVTGPSNGNRVSPGYFAALGTPIVAGRDFDGGDRRGSEIVAIVNQSFATTFFGGPAVGRRFTIPSDRGDGGVEYRVVGVVADQKYDDMRAANPRIFFVPIAQQAETSLTRRYVIRSTQPPTQAVAGIAAAVEAFDPSAAVRYALLDVQIEESMLQERLMARLSAIFGGVALLLAIVGLYGVVSYAVATRRGEIGVRVALGATRTRIMQLVLGDVGRMLAAGVGAGILLAMLAGRGIGALLYGLEPDDPVTLAGAVLLLIVTGFVAAVWPARRAASVDPASTLREG